jgi:hypothetical protein
MSPILTRESADSTTRVRAGRLADRLLAGARALADFAATLTDAQWHATVPGDGRSVGVVVHHVASVYPLEVELALSVAAGRRIAGVTAAPVDAMNAEHARQNARVSKREALGLLAENSAAAAATIRQLHDDELDAAAPVSLYADAEVTCQFVLEDHAVRHSLHHLARLRAAIGG